jgi:hypothetical protein
MPLDFEGLPLFAQLVPHRMCLDSRIAAPHHRFFFRRALRFSPLALRFMSNVCARL